MNVISQLTATLKHGTKECQATVLVQKGVFIKLLLVTDVLADLGLYIVNGVGPGTVARKSLGMQGRFAKIGTTSRCTQFYALLSGPC